MNLCECINKKMNLNVRLDDSMSMSIRASNSRIISMGMRSVSLSKSMSVVDISTSLIANLNGRVIMNMSDSIRLNESLHMIRCINICDEFIDESKWE